jgi:hypothetical protein
VADGPPLESLKAILETIRELAMQRLPIREAFYAGSFFRGGGQMSEMQMCFV